MTRSEALGALEFLTRYCEAGGMTREQLAPYQLSCTRVAEVVKPGMNRDACVAAMCRVKKGGKFPSKNTSEQHYDRCVDAIERHRFLSRQTTMPWGTAVEDKT